jgi:hypothetical protein
MKEAQPASCVAATITTANYWPYTAVLVESLNRSCPGWDVYVLALGELPGVAVPPNVHLLNAVDIWGDEVDACRIRFNLFEWAAASKPRLLRYLLDHAQPSLAIYVDSDIEFFAEPASVIEAAGSIVVQPNVAQLRECENAAWERLHLQYGTYNTGLVAVRESATTRSFLAWWDERVTRYCCTDPALDVFSDQKWFDLVPGLFADVTIDRSPGSNVALWNVRGRDLHSAGGRYMVGSQPLCFFHYHRVRLGMDVEAYLAAVDRNHTVRELVEGYLRKAERHSDTAQRSVPRHDTQPGGEAIPPVVYRTVRDSIAEGQFETMVHARPWSSAHNDQLRNAAYEKGRFRARLRVLSYHLAHARHVSSPEADIERYERSAFYRVWIDCWFLIHGTAAAQLPANWVLKSRWARQLRRALARAARAWA